MTHSKRFAGWLVLGLMGLGGAMLTGCRTAELPVSSALMEQASAKDEAIVLRAGDVVRLAFPGAPNLDDAQQIRRDGKLALKQGGEIVAAGKTLADFGIL